MNPGYADSLGNSHQRQPGLIKLKGDRTAAQVGAGFLSKKKVGAGLIFFSD
jgi:hypothetical protein